MKRLLQYLPALLLASSIVVLAPRAWTETAAPAAKEAEVKLDQAAPAPKGLRVAVLPVVNGSGEEDATVIMEDVLREEFKGVDPARAIFLMPQDVERVLGDFNAEDRADRLTARWARNGSLDSTAIVGLDSLLVADAIMLVRVSEWETKRAHNIGEGQSRSISPCTGFATRRSSGARTSGSSAWRGRWTSPARPSATTKRAASRPRTRTSLHGSTKSPPISSGTR